MGKKLIFVKCKSIVLCTGGFSDYFSKKKSKEINVIEIAFNSGIKLKNIEFVLTHPFGYGNNILPTENLQNKKIFDSKNKRLVNFEKELKSKNAHHILTELTKCFYEKNEYVKLSKNKKSKILLKPIRYYTLGGIKHNNFFETNISGVFVSGELAVSLSGSDRIGGLALSECVYSGIIAGKNSLKYNKENNKLKIKPVEKKLEKKYVEKKIVKIKKEFKTIKPSKSFKYFNIFNNKKNLQKGLDLAIKENNGFAKYFFKQALKRKKSKGCFFIKNS
jgi:succinate dehydrogenase/fumarate reductase flavoprotein subunit